MKRFHQNIININTAEITHLLFTRINNLPIGRNLEVVVDEDNGVRVIVFLSHWDIKSLKIVKKDEDDAILLTTLQEGSVADVS